MRRDVSLVALPASRGWLEFRTFIMRTAGKSRIVPFWRFRGLQEGHLAKMARYDGRLCYVGVTRESGCPRVFSV
jgi:hypothetical protein